MSDFLFTLTMILSLASSAVTAQTFSEFVATLETAADSARDPMIEEFLSHHTAPVIEGDSVHFLYRGTGKVVAVPGEMNRWNPSDAVMQRVARTDFFYRTYSFPLTSRVEYKIWVDSTWKLDSLNPRKARGGYGENSDLWMPDYSSPSTSEFRPDIPRGTIDTIWFSSKHLNRRYPVLVYTPPGTKRRQRLPVVYVTDGGEYISLGKMNNVLDNLITEGRIRPVLGVFVDPRTDPRNAATNERMTDYSANTKFLDFLEKELAPYIETKYPAARRADDRLIMGASMGGLISTYAVLKRPQFFHNCAAQSPAYLMADSAVIQLLKTKRTVKANIYIDTGTISDTQIEARRVKRMLQDKGARLIYAEYPEGHNWTNWRARLENIFQYFFPPK